MKFANKLANLKPFTITIKKVRKSELPLNYLTIYLTIKYNLIY